MKENVFNNCASFIKINESLNVRTIVVRKKKDVKLVWLDFTRIHPYDYKIAYKMAREALDNPKEDDN